jgi:hypothetical protein
MQTTSVQVRSESHCTRVSIAPERAHRQNWTTLLLADESRCAECTECRSRRLKRREFAMGTYGGMQTALHTVRLPNIPDTAKFPMNCMSITPG